MADDNVISMEERRKAYETALARYSAEDDQFQRGVWETVQQMRSLYDKNAVAVLHDITGRLVHVPYDEIFRDIGTDLEKRLQTGMIQVDFEEEESGVVEAHIIPMKPGIRPKKPKNPEEVTAPTMRVRKEETPEALKRRAEVAAAKEKLRQQREERLAHLREHYGEDAAQAFQALAGWK